MAKSRVPGVYFEPNVRISRRIELGETGVPAFLGVAERGPLNFPLKVINFTQYKQVYGSPVPGSYLSNAVEGFFLNGGRSCFVLRVAHVFRRGDDKSDLARRARYEVLDRAGYPALECFASSEGKWGNNVAVDVHVPDEPRVQTYLTLDCDGDEEVATLRSGRGFEPGMVVKLDDGEEQRFVTLTKVRHNRIFWQGALGHVFKAAAPTYVEPVEFNLSARTRERREVFPHLSLSRTAARYFVRVINSESQLLRVRDLESSSPPPENLPEELEATQLRDGQDGLEGLTPEDFIGYNNGPGARFGIGALEENEEVDLIVAPDLHFALASKECKGFRTVRDTQAVHRAMIDHCERMGDRFALLDLPEDTKVEAAIDWRLLFDSAFGAIFYPWLVTVERGERRNLPPCGHISGLMSRLDHEEGVHRAAANKPLEGVVDTSIVLREGHMAELNDKSVNCVRSFPVRGIRPWGAKTLSSDPMWRYIPVRRVFNAVRRAIYQGTQWVVFEPNNEALRDKLRSNVEDFLRILWSSGYFKGDTQHEAFFVKCDQENNTYGDIEAGMLTVDIGLAPIRPAEFISLRLEHTVEDRRLGDMADLES